MTRTFSLLVITTAAATSLGGCATSSWSGDKYGPQSALVGGAFGYKEYKTADKTWLLTYTGVDLTNALAGFDRRAHELCAQMGLSNFDVAAPTGIDLGGTQTSAGTTLPGGIIATASTANPSRTGYITCK